MENFDETEYLKNLHKTLIKDSPDGKWEEFPFDEDFWSLVAPLKPQAFLEERIDEISGESGKLTSAKITSAEAKVLAEHYLKELCDIYNYDIEHNGARSPRMRMEAYANKRINDLVESGAITKECVRIISSRIPW